MLDDLWARLLDALARTLPTPVLDNWVRPCRLVAVDGDHLRIGAPNKFSRDWLAQNYIDALHQAAREISAAIPASRSSSIPRFALRPGAPAEARARSRAAAAWSRA